jgi:enoyl-CoA hydratase
MNDADERLREEPTNTVLLIDTTDRVRTLTLNRPQSRNALSSQLRTAFYQALRDAQADEGVDVVILTGADPVFCAGLDLKEFGNTTELPDISPKWPAMSKPVIGAINGAAVTGGLELALYCDILIASEHARFADTHARVGLLPTWGLSVRLPQKVGVGLARRMSLTGDYLSAADALRAGLVTEVVAHDELLPAARRVAASIVGNNQAAVRALLSSYHRIDAAQTDAGLWRGSGWTRRQATTSPPTATRYCGAVAPRCTDCQAGCQSLTSQPFPVWSVASSSTLIPSTSRSRAPIIVAQSRAGWSDGQRRACVKNCCAPWACAITRSSSAICARTVARHWSPGASSTAAAVSSGSPNRCTILSNASRRSSSGPYIRLPARRSRGRTSPRSS